MNEVSQKSLTCHAPEKVGGGENSQLSNVSDRQAFCIFSRNFQSFLTLNKKQLPPLLFLGFYLDKKIPHKCKLNKQNEREHYLCKLPELLKIQTQIQVFESTTQKFTNFLEQTLSKPP